MSFVDYYDDVSKEGMYLISTYPLKYIVSVDVSLSLFDIWMSHPH